MKKIVHKPFVAALVTVMMLSACSGGSEGTGSSPQPTILNGSVSAPGGAVAFKEPDIVQRMLAVLWGRSVNAAIDGVTNVGAGVTVNLIQIDAAGNQVGDIVATATTDAGGEFTLEAPEDFTPGSQYVIRAEGSSEVIDARVADTTVDVSPITDAASDLVTSVSGSLDAISTVELEEFVTTVAELSKDINPSGLSAEALSDVLKTETVNDFESNNIFTSSVSTGQICGVVTNSAGNGVAGIRILVRDYNNWITRSKTKTASDGGYCLNVPKAGDNDPDTGGTFTGEYILGAINRTSNNSASEWWTAGGMNYSQHAAEKIIVADENTVEKNFQLEDGGTISGTITAGGLAPLEGVQVVVRNFDARTPVATARADANGNYRVNLIGGRYFVEARNRTALPFASEVYDAANGSNSSNDGTPVVVTTNSTTTLDFALTDGYRLSGTVTDGAGGTAVAGRRVMINLNSGGPSIRVRTNRLGNYRAWLAPDTYAIYTYGQRLAGIDLTSANQVVNFESPDVSHLAATVLHNGAPVSQAKVRLYTDTGIFIGQELSNSDGTVTAYSAETGNVFVEVRVDSAAEYGSIIHDNDTRLFSGLPVAIPGAASTVAVGDISLPAAGVLTGVVSSNGTPLPNFRVQVRDDNDLSGVSGGTTGNDRFTVTRTRGDGSYLLSLPAGVYDRVKMQDASLSVVNNNANCDTITIVAGQTTVVNYDDATDTCSY